jgi:CheY-like chemotaxis protein
MSGETLGRAISVESRFSKTRLIALISVDNLADAQRLVALGFWRHLTKPVRRKELKNVLLEAISPQNIASYKPPPLMTSPFLEREQTSFPDHNFRVLLVEDNDTNQMVALGILNRLGLNVDVVANGLEAVRSVSSIPYDLVLMDIQMPEMDGLEATRILRSQPPKLPNPDVVIVAMTAYAMQGDAERCFAAGMDDYIAKPVSPKRLGAVIEKWHTRIRNSLHPRETNTEASRVPPIPPTEIQLPRNEGSDAEIINFEAFLERVGGDASIADKVLEAFLSDAPKQLKRLEEKLAEGDAESVCRVLHSIKGASTTISSRALSSLAERLEELAESGSLALVQSQMNTFTALLARLEQVTKNRVL